MTFEQKYGPWAVIAGASEGLGLAFAEELARRRINLVLLARRAGVLSTVATKLKEAHGVLVRTLACDLSKASFADELVAATDDIEVGLGIFNAGHSFIGETLAFPLEEAIKIVDINCSGPLRLVHALAPKMVARGHGGFVLLASIGGFQGTARIAPYAASKAFTLVLGEGLWAELAPKGVDVLVSCPGAIRTPNYLKTLKGGAKEAPGTLDPMVVARTALDALGDGPMYIPGAVNRVVRFVLGRLMTRKAAVAIIAKNTADLVNG